MKRLLSVLFLLVFALGALGRTDVCIDLKDARLQAVPYYTNRIIWVQAQSVPNAQSPSVVLGATIQGATDTNGVYWVSNALPYLYLVTVRSSPYGGAQEQFKMLVTETNLGTVYAADILAASSYATFPAGNVAWAAAVTDGKYIQQLTSSNGTATFYPANGKGRVVDIAVVGGGGGGGATNGIQMLNGFGTNTTLYGPTFYDSSALSFTNAGNTFAGNGSGLTAISGSAVVGSVATAVTASVLNGVLSLANLPLTLQYLYTNNASQLTNINASGIAIGTMAEARMSHSVTNFLIYNTNDVTSATLFDGNTVYELNHSNAWFVGGKSWQVSRGQILQEFTYISSGGTLNPALQIQGGNASVDQFQVLAPVTSTKQAWIDGSGVYHGDISGATNYPLSTATTSGAEPPPGGINLFRVSDGAGNPIWSSYSPGSPTWDTVGPGTNSGVSTGVGTGSILQPAGSGQIIATFAQSVNANTVQGGTGNRLAQNTILTNSSISDRDVVVVAGSNFKSTKSLDLSAVTNSGPYIGTGAGASNYMAGLTAYGSNVAVGASSASFKVNVKSFAQNSTTVFTGTGLNDASYSGTSSSTGHTYLVYIYSANTPDSFMWTMDGGANNGPINITGSAQLLTNNISITFAATTGHTAYDQWVMTANVVSPFRAQNALGSNVLTAFNDGRVEAGGSIVAPVAKIGTSTITEWNPGNGGMHFSSNILADGIIDSLVGFVGGYGSFSTGPTSPTMDIAHGSGGTNNIMAVYDIGSWPDYAITVKSNNLVLLGTQGMVSAGPVTASSFSGTGTALTALNGANLQAASVGSNALAAGLIDTNKVSAAFFNWLLSLGGGIQMNGGFGTNTWLTNATLAGTTSFDSMNVGSLIATNWFTMLTNAPLLGTDANSKPTSVAVGSGLSLVGGTLSATGSGTGIQTNGGTGINNVLSNLTVSAGMTVSNGSLTVLGTGTNYLGATVITNGLYGLIGSGAVTNAAGSRVAYLSDTAAGSGWQTTGNSGLTESAILGTTDGHRLHMRVNNVEVGLLDSTNIVFGSSQTLLVPVATSTANANVISGGSNNTISNTVSGADTIAGGTYNTISSAGADNTISGGTGNFITNSPSMATIAGGTANYIGGTTADLGATVVGGVSNYASKAYSFAAGTRAQATNQGAFVWSDSTSGVFGSTNNDSFNVRAAGGVNFQTGSGSTKFSGAISALSFSGNGSGLTNLGGIVNVRDFGAATNLADNSSEFNAAIIAATNASPTGAEVIIPEGTFAFTSPIYTRPGVTLRGQSGDGTILQFSGLSTNAVQIVQGYNNWYFGGVGLKNLRLYCASAIGGNAVQLAIDSASPIKVLVDNVGIIGPFAGGIYSSNVEGGYIKGCHINGTLGDGIFLDQYSLDLDVSGNYVKANGGFGIRLATDNCTVYANHTDANTNGGFYLMPHVLSTTLLNNGAEHNHTNQYRIENAYGGVSLINCYANGAGGYGSNNGFYFKNSVGVILDNPRFYSDASNTNGGWGIFLDTGNVNTQVKYTDYSGWANFGSGQINDWTRATRYETNGIVVWNSGAVAQTYFTTNNATSFTPIVDFTKAGGQFASSTNFSFSVTGIPWDREAYWHGRLTNSGANASTILVTLNGFCAITNGGAPTSTFYVTNLTAKNQVTDLIVYFGYNRTNAVVTHFYDK